MATTKLILRKNKSTTTGVPVYVQYCYKGGTATFSTGEKVDPRKWSVRKECLKGDYRETIIQNAFIENEKAKVETIVRIALVNSIEPTLDYVRAKFYEETGRARPKSSRTSNSKSASSPYKPQQKGTLYAAFEEFVKTNAHKRAEATITVYRSTLKHLKAFHTYWGRKPSFRNMDANFYDGLTSYFFEELEMANSTAGKYIKTLKTFLHWATDQGYGPNPAFIKWVVFRDDTEIIYLSDEELQRLYQLDLRNNTRLDHIRDCFCFQCFTGVRYSDLAQLKPEHIKGDTIVLNTIKTRKTVKIPIISQAREIIDKYEGQYINLLPVISNIKYNIYLKELAQLAGLDSLETIIHYRGGRRVETTFEKWELVTTHTGRRTFITLSLQKGMRPEVLMKVTGHSSIKTLMRYVKIVETVQKEEMMKAWG